jgi:hypothetical protein
MQLLNPISRTAFLSACMLLAVIRSLAQPVILLPSSYIGAASNDSAVCLATETSICFGRSFTDTLECVTVPASMFGVATWAVTGIALSKDGRYCFAAVAGADGLYRYDRQVRQWRTITPPSAGSDVSALYVDDNGIVTIGTGGSPASSANDARGLYQSTNNGDEWTPVEFQDSSGLAIAGVTSIKRTDTGPLAISCVRKAGRAEPGIYLQRQATSWRRVSNLDGQLVEGGRYLYSVNATGSVTVVDLLNTASPPAKAGAPGSYADVWNGDTVALFYDRQGDGASPVLNLVVGTAVVRTIPLTIVPDTREQLRYATACTPEGLCRIVLLGAGENRLLDARGEHVATISSSVQLPSVSALSSAGSWAVVRVNNHGWYRLTPDLETTYDATLNGIMSPSSIYVRSDSGGLLVTRPSSIFSVTTTGFSSVVTIESDTTLLSSVRLSSNEILAATREFGLISFSTESDTWRTYDTTGLPRVSVSGGGTRVATSVAVFRVGPRLYAWFNPGGVQMPTEAGLYQYDGGWAKVEIAGLPEDGSLVDITNDSSSAVITLHYFLNGRVSDSRVLSLRGGKPWYSVVSDSLSSVPYITTSAAGKGYPIWLTAHGAVWTVTESLTNRTQLRSGLNVLVSALEEKILIATRDQGLIVLDSPTSVGSYDSVGATQRPHLWPSPAGVGERVRMRLNMERHHITSVSVYDLVGQQVSLGSVDIIEDGDSSVIIIPSPAVPGLYVVVIAGHNEQLGSPLRVVGE